MLCRVAGVLNMGTRELRYSKCCQALVLYTASASVHASPLGHKIASCEGRAQADEAADDVWSYCVCNSVEGGTIVVIAATTTGA